MTHGHLCRMMRTKQFLHLIHTLQIKKKSGQDRYLFPRRLQRHALIVKRTTLHLRIDSQSQTFLQISATTACVLASFACQPFSLSL